MRFMPSLVAVATLVVVLTAAVALATNVNSAEHNGLLHVIETDECCYPLPDSVDISYVVSNVTGHPIVVELAAWFEPVMVTVYDPAATLIWSDPAGWFPDARMDTLLPGESYAKETTWDMYSYIEGGVISEPGIYAVGGYPMISWPDSLFFEITIPIAVLEESTVPERIMTQWGAIKALYR